MSISLNPQELSFRRPFNREVTQTLQLGNLSQRPLAFKVKTTAPKQYCVRPNSGRIEPGKNVEVQVLLQAMKDEPPVDARCRDKFLVQCLPIAPEVHVDNVAAIWQQIDGQAKSLVEERKLRVVFLPAEGTANATLQSKDADTSRLSVDQNSLSAFTPSHGSPGLDTFTPDTRSSKGNARNSMISDTSGLDHAETTSGRDMSTDAQDGDLRNQLAEAQDTIARLKQEMSSQGLRQRKSDAVTKDAQERLTTGTMGMGVQRQIADGVPVQIVAGLCLLSFLLAYFLF